MDTILKDRHTQTDGLTYRQTDGYHTDIQILPIDSKTIGGRESYGQEVSKMVYKMYTSNDLK